MFLLFHIARYTCLLRSLRKHRVGLCRRIINGRFWKLEAKGFLFCASFLQWNCRPGCSSSALREINSLVTIFTSSWYEGIWWNPFLPLILQMSSKCWMLFIKNGKSLECLMMLSWVWNPVDAFLISRFKISTYSSKAMFLFLPPETFINLLWTSLSVWSLERVPDVRLVRWMLPIRYLVFPVLLYSGVSYLADLTERGPSPISTAESKFLCKAHNRNKRRM